MAGTSPAMTALIDSVIQPGLLSCKSFAAPLGFNRNILPHCAASCFQDPEEPVDMVALTTLTDVRRKNYL